MSSRIFSLFLTVLVPCWSGAQPTFQKQLDGITGLFCLEQAADSSYWIGTFLGKILHFDAKGQWLNGLELHRGDTTSCRFVYDLERAPAGGVYALYDRSNYVTALDDHLILARLDATGAPLWQTSVYFGEVQHWAHNRLTTDAQGNVYVSSVRLNPVSGNLNEPNRIILTKVDAAGVLQWTKSFRGGGLNYPRALQRLSDGSLLICGNGQISAPYGFLLRLSADGQPVWSRRYDHLLFKAFAELPDGSWALAATEPGPLPQAAVLARLNPQGELLWAQRLQMPNALNWIPGLAAGPSGNILLFNYETPASVPSPDLISFSADGSFQWARRYDACLNPGISAGLVSADGGIAGLRYRAAGHLLLKTDAQGICANCPGEAFPLALAPLTDQPLPLNWEVADWPLPVKADVDFRPFAVVARDYCGQEKPVNGIGLDADSLCTFQTAGARASGSGQADAYQWTFSDGTPPQLTGTPAPTGVFFSTPGPATITLETRFGFCRDTFTTVVNVEPGPAPIRLGPDTTLCGLGARLPLDATTAGATGYQWNDGATAPLREVVQAGTYIARAVAGACSVSDTIQVNFQEQLTVVLGADTLLCDADTLWLDASVPGAERYHWSDGLETPRRPVTQSGFYAATASRAGCSGTGFIRVELFPRPPALPADTVLCEGEPLLLGAGENPGDAVFWNGQAGLPMFSYDGSGTVRRMVKYRHCRFEDKIAVHRAPCRQGFAFYAPNAFAPDGNAENATFALSGSGLEVLELQLFDRWGNRVFLGKNTAAWDGTTRDKPAATGVYTWLARLRQRNREGWLSGDVLLVR